MKRSNNGRMEIRPLDDADVDAVIRVWIETKRDTYDFIALERSYSEADNHAFFRGVILAGCAISVAVEDGAVLGFLAQRGSYVDRLYVHPAAQRRGVGAALLARAIDASPAGIELHTHQQNHKARAFYERMGFVVARFGVSPPPESLPDVEYHWRPRQCG
jgi:ribosomal protein S18 acetylase RimI-like enzyme